jgi:hypothetical protein
MYLVELKPGKEELYRTGDELAIAIREGEVDARSRIYHRATAKWISITLHPQYKAIVAAQDEPPRPARKGWSLLPAGFAGVPVELSSTQEVPAAGGSIRQRWKRPIGLGLASILLISGIQLAFSGPRPPWSNRVTAAKQVAESASEWEEEGEQEREVQSSPSETDMSDVVSLASTTATWTRLPAVDSAPVIDTLPELVASTQVLPRAPRLRPKALRAALAAETSNESSKGSSVQALLSRYEAASGEAYTRLESGMRVARLQRLFSTARLTPGGGITDTRMSLAGAANFIRVYRAQQAAVDRAYQDSVTTLAKRYKWTRKDVQQWHNRPPRQENPTLQLLTGSLLSTIDSILGVLGAEAGAYKLRGSAIAFEDPAATQSYGALRKRIKEQIDAAVAAGGATSLGPTGLLLQAIGTSTLPRET